MDKYNKVNKTYTQKKYSKKLSVKSQGGYVVINCVILPSSKLS